MKEICCTLSNGGVGPGYGLIGIDSGVRDDQNRDLVAIHKWFLGWSKEMEDCPWPRLLLPILHWGCGIYACADLDTEENAVIDFDHHDWEETPETWNDCFQELSYSFDSWWAQWLTDKETKSE